MNPTRRQPWAVRHRDAIMFARDCVFTIFGVWIIYHEVFQREDPREIVLAVALALCGLPVALRLDRILSQKSDYEEMNGTKKKKR